MNEYLQSYLDCRDYNKIADDCVEWIRAWFDKNGKGCKAIIGISGGKDSSIVAALCVKALGKDRVFGVLMPNGTQSDISVSRHLVEFLGIENREVNIEGSFKAIKKSLEDAGIDASSQTIINLPPRLRMATLYALSQSLNGRVANTCNRSEDHVGYATIFGDAAGDFSPLANLTVAEVKAIGHILGLPDEFVEKPPSDGLQSKTDEDNLGFTYEQLDTYILTGICKDEALKEKIDKRHAANLFKLMPMASFKP